VVTGIAPGLCLSRFGFETGDGSFSSEGRVLSRCPETPRYDAELVTLGSAKSGRDGI